MRPALVQRRWPVGGLAAVGVLLAIPSVFWPVLALTSISPAHSDAPAQSFTEQLWSWGRSVWENQTLADASVDGSSFITLGLLVASLTVGASGVVAWSVVRGEPGRSLGIVTTSVVAAGQLVWLAQWLALRLQGIDDEGPAFQLEVQPAGWLQLAAASALFAALGVMLWRPARAAALSTAGLRVLPLRSLPIRRPGRGALLAGVGVLLALPSAVWPVLVSTIYGADDAGDPVPMSQRATWGWGKYTFTFLSGPDAVPELEVSNPLGLFVLLGCVVIGMVGVVAWGSLRGEPGRSLGGASAAVLAAAQLAFIGDWLGLRHNGWDVNAATFVEQPAGWAQMASVLVLLVALAFMPSRPMRTTVAPTGRRLIGADPGAKPSAVEVDGERTRSTPITSARRREVDERGGRSRPVDGPAVGFSDSRPERTEDARRPERLS